jgi:hypothetical protein
MQLSQRANACQPDLVNAQPWEYRSMHSLKLIGAAIAAVAALTLLTLATPASAFTLAGGAPVVAGVPIDRVWWDYSGHWHHGKHAEPHYECWRPPGGPRRCEWHY